MGDYPPVSPYGAGLTCRCPRCSRGKVFNGVLTVVEKCSVCGLNLSAHDAGDGPAFLVIFILSFLIGGGAFWLEFAYSPPLWVHVIAWVPATFLLAILMLRILKALLIALEYRHNILKV